MYGLWIIFGIFALISWLISRQLQKKFKEYSKIPVFNNMTGRDVVEKMLRDHGIFDVKIGTVSGQLSDHYNPVNKTINLSKEVYFGSNVSAAAVAAHECGHAVQHAQAYSWLSLRSKLVPFVSFVSNWVQWVLLLGIIMVSSFPQLLLFGIILFATTTLFSIITLPVEIDASNRALVWLKSNGITSNYNHDKAKHALKLAAYSYVNAALMSLATLFYYIMIFIGGTDD